jgi:hypothetical protein
MEDYCDDYRDRFHTFQREGSALRRASRGNPRNLPCPTCKAPNHLTPADSRQGYQCDGCARQEEGP